MSTKELHPEMEPEVCADEHRVEPSALSKSVSRLRGAVLKTIRTRDRLPHPLFWSLFHTEIQSIKERKDSKREERKKLLYPYKEE